MRRDAFLLETLSHFVRDDDGPPPGVPARVDPGFETTLAATCQYQRVTPIVSRSLDRLVLPPSISRVTAERLRRRATQERAETARRLASLDRIVHKLDRSGVEALVCGEVLSASYYTPAELRHVAALELLVDEHDVAAALDVLAREGYEYPGTHPVFGPSRRGSRVSRRRAAELVAFHHYFAPLVVRNGSAEAVRLRLRVPDVGNPEARERAWERRRRVTIDGRPFDGLAHEDHLLDLAVAAGATGLAWVPWIVDIGRLLRTSEARMDWDYFSGRARLARVYAAVRYAVRHACRRSRITDVARHLDPASALGGPAARAWWRPDDIDYGGEPRRRSGRFRYGLAWYGGPRERLRWVWRHLTPRGRWIRNRVGAGPNAWRWLEFLLVVRDGAAWPIQGTPPGRGGSRDNIHPIGVRPGSRT